MSAANGPEPDVIAQQGRSIPRFARQPGDKLASTILSHPFNQLRFEFVQSLREEHPEGISSADLVGQWITRIRTQLPVEGAAATRTAEDAIKADPADIRRDFEAEVRKVTDVLKGKEDVKPNPSNPYSKLLWAVAMHYGGHAQMEVRTSKGMEADAAAMQVQQKMGHLLDELANSQPMEAQRQRFYGRVSSVNRHAIGIDNETQVRYGRPGSWFYMRRGQINPQTGAKEASLINLDLFYSLVLGDYVDAVFQHELEHAEKSLDKPARIEALHQKVRDLKKAVGVIQAEAGKPVVIPEEQKGRLAALLAAEYELNLRHGLWNAIEDNMCNQGLSELRHHKLEPYHYYLDHSINVISALIAGTGLYVTGQKAIEPKVPEDPSAKLESISHAMNMAFFLRNGLAEDSPAHWQDLGVDIRAIKHKDHPDWSPERAYQHMKHRLDEIAISHPWPDNRGLGDRQYRELCQTTCAVRNDAIEALFRDYLDDYIEQAITQFKEEDLEQQLDQLQKAAQAAANGQRGGAPAPGGGAGSGIPIQVNGADGPVNGSIPDEPGTQPGAGIPDKDGVGNGRSMKDLQGRHFNDDGTGGPGGRTKSPQAGQAPVAGNSSPGTGGAGAAGSALAALQLGDGRSLKELRASGEYKAAVHEVADCLAKIARQFPNWNAGLERDPTSMQPEHIHERYSPQAAKRLVTRLGVGDATMADARIVRRVKEVKVETPGDLYLMVDSSGSMGVGKGSRLEYALKTAALMRDAGKKAGELLHKGEKGGFGVYITLWGNQVPTVLATPESNEAVVDGLLDRAISGEFMKGLHGGTELAPSIAGMLYHFSQGKSGDVNQRGLRGPAHALVVSDGGLYGESINYAGMLNGLAPLTFDTILTEGKDSVLHRELVEAQTKLKHPHQKPVCQEIAAGKDITLKVADWAQKTLGKFQRGDFSQGKPWSLTQANFKQESDRSFRDFCRASNIDIGPFIKEMAKQQGGVAASRAGIA